MSAASSRRIEELPSALERRSELLERIGDRGPVVFLDYDGTLTAIVDNPDDALMDGATRRVLAELASRCPVAVVSGRDLDDVREKVGVDGIYYAGSHGFDILEPGGRRHRRGTEYRPALERAGASLERAIGDVRGARVEAKAFALAVHFRQVEDPAAERRVADIVDEVASREPELKKTGGKKIFELRPAMRWDKGRAIRWILDTLRLPGDRVPVYVGDDMTDEDAFRALGEDGLGIVVEGETDRDTAADYSLPGPEEVRSFLELLVDAVREEAEAVLDGGERLPDGADAAPDGVGRRA